MAKYRIVRTEFWKNPIVEEEMTPEEKYFYLYLLTNPDTTQIGIYRITTKQMAFDLGYSIETVHLLMERFIQHYKLIRYNSETRELAIKDWGKDNLYKGGKPVMACVLSQLKEVADRSLIRYVAEMIPKQDIRSLYESFCGQESVSCAEAENDSDLDGEYEEADDTFTRRDTIRGQKEKQKENEKEKQQQKDLNLKIENNLGIGDQIREQKMNDVVVFWDNNGFGFSNMNVKKQLLCWLDDSPFLQPKDVILKTMTIAFANNRRTLGYVVGILSSWAKESLLTVQEIDAYHEKRKHRRLAESLLAGRVIPSGQMRSSVMKA